MDLVTTNTAKGPKTTTTTRTRTRTTMGPEQSGRNSDTLSQVLHGSNRAVWRKVLYDPPNCFPDNYTPDECFLDAIERNKNVHKYSLCQCFCGSCQVALQMCSVVLFAAAYHSLSEGLVASETALFMVVLTSLAGYVMNQAHSSAGGSKGRVHAKNVAVFVCFGLGLTPVLHNLTATISTDSIYAMTASMLCVHLLFHDYGLQSAVVSNVLSINASLFASVCLASRLPSSLAAFVLLTLSVELFVLFPILRRRLNTQSVLLLTAFAVSASVAIIAIMSTILAALACLGLGLVLLVCPMQFHAWQRYKDTIHGPWDEAVPHI